MAQTESYNEIVISLGELHKKMRQVQTKMLAEYQISLMEFHILRFLMETKFSSQNDLVLALDVDKALISRHIRLMEERGLLSSSVDPDCHRRKILSLTAFALEILPKLEEVHKKSLELIFQDLDEKELQSFKYILEGLVRNL